MTRITVDDVLREKLLNFNGDIEICDPRGYVLARVQACAPWSHPEQWEPVKPFTEEEIQRSLDSDGPSYTTEEVLDKLRKL